ncbi:MAG: succinate dehydrogenase/fumarate reductase iron-sulfur subunit [Candidatus Eisenbacteria bacterium]|uniref:Succinate dehydrogenase/fumarate reductase iron-sulfur subunit n=1 Tax=Eiseniibacteriota bacterium TaxID=2212470 RepID=A0A538UD53_UNCEI|nr:MAG: succinate dehydrogenase/fumarate reductase iron-sulfur subunit [Candidatus Eisenbacteria bacterium]
MSAGAVAGAIAGATAGAAAAAAGARVKAEATTAKREAVLRVYRGDASGGQEVEYQVPVETGMVVLDAIHWIQAHQAPDLAVRWNCKAAKCGSCSAEVNGKPALMCKSRMERFAPGEPIVVRPMKTFPIIRDLVTDVSWNFEVNQRIPPFQPRAGAEWKWQQHDVDRAQEFRKCIECFLCQDVCHVLRSHELKHQFAGPRFLVRIAGLEMHPIDGVDRTPFLKDSAGIGFCNITKCCTEVCPEDIHITDNAIIPLKERVVDRFYDPVQMVWRAITGK